jgi:hypothetical protein
VAHGNTWLLGYGVCGIPKQLQKIHQKRKEKEGKKGRFHFLHAICVLIGLGKAGVAPARQPKGFDRGFSSRNADLEKFALQQDNLHLHMSSNYMRRFAGMILNNAFWRKLVRLFLLPLLRWLI